MPGMVFIVNIPRKEHEDDLKKSRSAKLGMEKEKYEKASKLIRELKTNKRFGDIKSTFESYRGELGLSKCKSTECVHESGDFGLLKSKSENVLNESYKLALSDGQLQDKTWDIKQMMKRKKKLRITQPPSITDVSDAFHWDTPLELILSEVITRLNIVNSASWTSTKENRYWQVLFSLDSCYESEELLQVLRNLGIGSRYNSSISVIPCPLYFSASNEEEEDFENDIAALRSETVSAWRRFSSTVHARANLAQILHGVRNNAALTFDWVLLLVVAAFVTAIGLVENSTVILVASVLISPIMAPITAGTLGTAVRDRSLQQLGVLHELLGLFLALVIGFIFGLAVCAVGGRHGVSELPTHHMMMRSEIRSLWIGVLVTIPSGAGAALSVLGERTAPLVGVAISMALLPPAVNAGLLWAMSFVSLIFADDEERFTGLITYHYSSSSDQATELAVLGLVSLCLTLINIASIFMIGVAVYKMKQVCPMASRDILWWRANKKSQQSSNGFYHNNNNNTKWEKYSNFSNDCKNDQEVKEPAHLIQSDTVTFRRETPAIRRMRAQTIETYCLQKEQFASMPNNFEANLQDERHIYNSIENLPLKSDIPDIRISNNIEKENFYNKERITDLDNVNSFCNGGYEEENFVNKGFEQNMEKQCPVIEPSSNLTVDPKPRIILGSQSYNV